MQDLVTITVDGAEIQVPKGTLLWEACHANGIGIPIFCYHTKLGPVGACRTCLVELEGARGPITACSTPVTDGMKVRTRTAVVEKMQRGIFEFLLLNHPLDCPICDRAGECPLQDQTFAYGPGVSRYIEPKRHHVKPIAIGPTVALDRERCVLCWRCVRFCAEVAEDKSIILLDRGDHSVVGTFEDEPYVSNFSGNVIELCPVGALTSRKQRFNFRPWELQNRPSICPHCAFGCNINISVRKNDEVIRFLSRDNPEVDNSWLCDRGRFNFEFVNSPQRLKAPLIRSDEGFVETSWDEAFTLIAERLKPVMQYGLADAVAGIASPRLTNEDLFAFKRFMADVVGTRNVDHYPRPQLVLEPAQQRSLSALADAVAPIQRLEQSKAILLLGADPSAREPVMELRIRSAVNKHGAALLVLGGEDQPLREKAAAVVGCMPADFSSTVRSLATEIGASSRSGDGSLASFLQEGPVTVVYDDSFSGVVDKGEALEAVASLVEALGSSRQVGVIPLLDDCNSMGARDLSILPGDSSEGSWGPSTLTQLLAGPDIRAMFILGSNIVRDEASDELNARLDALDLLVVSELNMTETARRAHVVLPAASFAEKVGTFTNTERRVQLLGETVPAPGIARADWEILVDLSQYFDAPLNYASPQEIWDDLARAAPMYSGLSYSDIGPTGARAGALQTV